MGDEPPSKKQKLVQGTDDQVKAALLRIAPFMAMGKKFCKASTLLRQLLLDGKLEPRHGELVFEALRLSMLDLTQSDDPLLRRDYVKTFTAFSKQPQLFTTRERSQLDVLGVWAVFRNQLHTDDSFAFNKVVSQLKSQIAELEDADDEDDDVIRSALEQQADASSSKVLQDASKATVPQEEGNVQLAPPPAAPDDIFGLDSLMEQQEAADALTAQGQDGADKNDKKRRTAATAWSNKQIAALRRLAVLDCIKAAKTEYHNVWARTTVDLLIEQSATKLRTKFSPQQAKELNTLYNWVKQQRMLRKSGGADGRDVTSFERASAAWGRADVSARGKIGSQGDAKASAWLG